ncbi:MAG: M20 family metallopeptidase [Desulfobacteraceae bacterium]|nr:M20 family metallopeptidase [Desulfobacteraceae bacterium]
MISDKIITKVLSSIRPGELIELASELVRINTVWDPAAGTSEQPAADLVAEWAGKEGFSFQMDEVAPGRSNVIIRFPGGPGEKSLIFEGHTDVVTPGDVSAWIHDPFGAEIKEGRMYGRGTNDTKGNLAAMLMAMSAIKRSGVMPNGNIIGAVLCDEEDQMLGVLDFIKKGHADRATAAVICEPQDGLVCNTQKGAIRARFEIAGRMSHGAMPLSGLNTAPAVSALIQGLMDLEKAAIESVGRDEHLGWPSYTPTVVQSPCSGPAQLNVMPGKSCLLADIRTIPGQSHEKIRSELTHLAAEVEQKSISDFEIFDRRIHIHRDRSLRIKVEFLTDRPCTLTAREDPIVQSAVWASRQISGKVPEYAGVPGATDGTFLWSMKNIPLVIMGAGDREVPHQVDEWVDLDQLVNTAKIYALTALHYLQ